MAARRFRLALLAGTALWPAVSMPQTVAPNAQPSGGRVVAGAAAISQNATTTTINQTSGRAAIDWNSFNVGANQSVRFNQPGAQSWTLNRVTTPDPSVIAGRISANGGVAIVNQSGVVFAAGAQVNVAGLIASAANITNQDFMAGRMAFTGPANPGARVENHGTITVADHGLAVLAGPRVANSGIINARLGRVALQGAEAFTLDLAGDGLLSLDVTQQVRSAPDGGAALVTNTGTIQARGGSVQLSASAISGLVETLVNNTGHIAVGGGQAVLRAEGGNVNAGGSITARSRSGQGGSISATATGDVTVPSGALLDASGGTGGGRVAVGSAITARATVAAGATVRADATRRGNGGTVVVNSERSTTVQGTTSARGGRRGGDGGLVETSSGGALLVATLPDVRAPAGRNGIWLVDPVNLVIRDSAASGGTETDLAALGGGVFTTDGAGGNPATVVIAPSVIQGFAGDVMLEASHDLGVLSAVTRTAGQGMLTLKAGNALTVVASLTVADGISLQAVSGGISLNAAVTTAATSSVTLNAGGSITQAAGKLITTGTLALTAGDFVLLTAANAVDSVSISAAGQSVSFTSANALTVTGLTADTAGLRGANLALTGAIAGTTSLSLTSTAGGIQQTASGLITTSSLTVAATGGNVALGQANAVGNAGITASGAVAFGTAGNLALGAVSGTSVAITSGGTLTTSAAVRATTGDLALTATGALTLGGNVTADLGNVALRANGPGSAIVQNSGTITAANPLGRQVALHADSLTLGGGGINAGALGQVLLAPATAGRGVSLGGSAAGTLLVDNTLLGGMTAGRITIGDAATGDIGVLGVITTPAVLELVSGGGISQAAGAIITAGQGFSATAAGDIALGEANAIADILGSTAAPSVGLAAGGDLRLGSGAPLLTLHAKAQAGSGRSATVQADNLDIPAGGGIEAPGGGTVNILPMTPGTQVSLGTDAAHPGLYLDSDEAGRIATGGGTLRIGGDGASTTAGAIALRGNLALRAAAATLDLRGASVAQTGGGLDIARLTGATSGDFFVAGASNSIDTLGDATAANLRLRDNQALTVAGTVRVGDAGTLEITAAGLLTVASTASLQAGTRAGADTGEVQLWGRGIALAGPVQAGSRVALTSSDSLAAVPTAAVAGADITQSGLGVVTTRRLAALSAGAIQLGLANGVDRAALQAWGAGGLLFNTSGALALQADSFTAFNLGSLITLGTSFAAQGDLAITSAGALSVVDAVRATAGNLALTGTGLVSYAADIEALAGNVAVTAQGPGSQLTRLGGDILAMASGASITLTADRMDFGAPAGPVLKADATTGLVRLQSATPGLAVSLGAETAGRFSIFGAGPGLTNAARLVVGDAAAGSIAVTGDFHAGATTLELLTGGGVSQQAGTVLSADALSATAVGSVVLDGANAIGAVAGSSADAAKGITAGGDVALTSTAALLGVNAAITAGAGHTLTLVADDLALAARLMAPGGTVRLLPYTAGRGVTLGGSAAGTLALSSTEIALIGDAASPAARLVIGSDTGGAIALAGDVDLRDATLFNADRVQVLELRSGAAISQTAGTRLNVAGLAAAGTSVALASTANAVDQVVALSGETDGLRATSGDLALTSLRSLTVNADVTAARHVALTVAALAGAPAAQGLTNNAAITAGTLDAAGGVHLTVGPYAWRVNNAGSIAAPGDVLVDGGLYNSGSISGRDVTLHSTVLDAFQGILNQAGASITAARDLTIYNHLENHGSLTAGTGAGGGSLTVWGSVVNSGAMQAGSATQPGDVAIQGDYLRNEASGSITAASALRLGLGSAGQPGSTNDGLLQSGIGPGGGSIVMSVGPFTNNGTMLAGSATLAGSIDITLDFGNGGSLVNAAGAIMRAGDDISVGFDVAAASASTLDGSIQAGLRGLGGDVTMAFGNSVAVLGSVQGRDIHIDVLGGSIGSGAALTASRDIALTGFGGTPLQGIHSAGRDLSISGDALILAGQWTAHGNVSLTAPGGIVIAGLVGTDGAGPAGLVQVDSSGGALSIASGGLLYGRRLEGTLGASTSLTDVARTPGASGVAFGELGGLSVGGDFSFTVTDPAALPYRIDGIISVGSGRALTLVADDLDITANAGPRAPGGSVTLRPYTDGRGITLGGSGAGTLALSTDELARIGSTAMPVGTLTIGSATAGDITLAGDVRLAAGNDPLQPRVRMLNLLSGGSVRQAAGTMLLVPTLAATVAGDLLLDPGGNGNRILGTAGLAAGGDLFLASDQPLLTLAGTTSVGAGHTLRLRADDLAITGQVQAPDGVVELVPVTAGRGITLGGAGPGTLALDGAELALLGPIGTLRIGGIGGGPALAGDITLAGPVSLPGVTLLDLHSGGSFIGTGSPLVTGMISVDAAGDVLLDNADNRFIASTITAGAGRTIRLTDPPDLVLSGPISAPGGLVVLSSADAILQLAGAVITTGTLQVRAGGRVSLGEANSFDILGDSSMGGPGLIRGLNYSVAGTVISGGALKLIADGALSVPGHVASGGALALVGGSIGVGGSLGSGADISAEAGGAIELTGAANAAGALDMAAGGSFTLGGAGSASAGGAMRLSAGSTLLLAGQATAGGALLMTSGGAMTLGGGISAGSMAATAGGAAAFSGRATVGGAFSLSASGAMTLAGTLAAETASLRGASMVLDGLRASIGRAIVFAAPGGIGAGGTTTIAARTAGRSPAVVFDTRRGSNPDPLDQVQADIQGLSNAQQATQVRRPGIQAPASFGAANGAAAGTMMLDLAAGSSPVFLLLDGGAASGSIAAGRLGIHGTGGSASLFGSLGGVPGAAAASAADITRPVAPGAQASYRINGCVVASVNCVPPPIIQFVLVRPAEVVDLTLVNNRIDTSEVTIPNVAEIEYQ